jgi:hypothetical protein
LTERKPAASKQYSIACLGTHSCAFAAKSLFRSGSDNPAIFYKCRSAVVKEELSPKVVAMLNFASMCSTYSPDETLQSAAT